MKDGRALSALKALVRAGVLFDTQVSRAVHRLRGGVRFRLGGDCRRCARCCEAPAIRAGRLTWAWPRLRRAFLWWQERVNGFVLVEARRADRSFVFRCTHFEADTRSCDSYASRPAMCRDYPRLLLFQPAPELLPGCGYRAVAPNAAALRQALDAQELSREQHERLEKGLHLR